MSGFARSYKSWYDLFYLHSVLIDVSLHSGSHTPTVAGDDLLWYFIMVSNDGSSFLSWLVASLSVHTAGSGVDVWIYVIYGNNLAKRLFFEY